MADPIVTDWYKAQWIWKGKSKLPHDVFVNSWVFRNDQGAGTDVGTGTIHADIEAVLRAFYLEAEPTTGRSIISWLSSELGPEAELRIYDLGQRPPREPVVRPQLALPARATSPLPSEVALCLSFFSGRNLPRRRGRVYIGPLGGGASVDGGQGQAVPPDPLLNTLIGRATNVARTSRGARWGVFSRSDANCFPVSDFWVDNAFDTQRRRGLKPNKRMVGKK